MNETQTLSVPASHAKTFRALRPVKDPLLAKPVAPAATVIFA